MTTRDGGSPPVLVMVASSGLVMVLVGAVAMAFSIDLVLAAVPGFPLVGALETDLTQVVDAAGVKTPNSAKPGGPPNG